ncbi:MAG TPA: pseudouridine synthase [Clostridia bacterium]|nr:pseudouridine synthase [Clostridia bacterium]
MKIPILYQDSSLVIIDKPSGLLMHSNHYTQNQPNCINILGGIVQKKVLICHRLDRRTSGAVVFALRKDAATSITAQFKEHKVEKRYLALVRGHLADEVFTDQPIRDFYSEEKKYVEAESRIKPLAHGELPQELLPAEMNELRETLYTLVQVELLTGKTHQARSHLDGLGHPVIGDNLHGDKRQNQLFQEVFASEEMFLRSCFLQFTHPATQKTLTVSLGAAGSWLTVLKELQFPAEHIALKEAQVTLS